MPRAWSTPTPGLTARWEHLLSEDTGFVERALRHAAVRARQEPFQNTIHYCDAFKPAQYTAIHYGETLMLAGRPSAGWPWRRRHRPTLCETTIGLHQTECSATHPHPGTALSYFACR